MDAARLPVAPARIGFSALALLVALTASLLSQQPPEPAPSPRPEAERDLPVQMESDDPLYEETAEEPAAEPAAEPAGTEPAEEIDLDRSTFELRIPEEDGGGTVTGSADALEFDGEDLAILTGDVHLKYQDLEVRAQRIEYERDTQRVVATGDVIFDQGPRRLAGTELELDLDTKLGRVLNARGSVTSDYYFTAGVVEKTGDDTFRIEDGVFSSCEAETPQWSFRATAIRVKVDGYAKARNATFRAKKVPLIYFPYILWPTGTERTSGFLVPKPGYSSRRGASLGLAYYQTLGRSADTTFHLDLYGGGAPEGSVGSGNFLGIGNELRYRPTEGTQGIFQGYVIDDPEFDDTRWKMTLDHDSRDLPWGFRGVVRIEDVSDFAYFQDYERRGDRNSQRQLYSTAYVSKNWGSQSFNVNFDTRETLVGGFAAGETITLKQLPEVEYKIRSTRLWETPLYFELKSSMHLLDVDRGINSEETYGRGDLFPQVTLPIRTVPWLSLSVTAGARYTWWSDSLLPVADRAGADSVFSGEGLSRFLPVLSAEIIGPSFSKIWEGGGKRFSRFKHVVEPRITYGFVDEYDDDDLVAVFDEVDNFNSLQGVRGRNVTRFSLFNKLLAKPVAEEGESSSAREILSLTVYQDVSLDDDDPLQFSADRSLERNEGPLTFLLRWNPSRRTSLKTELGYNSLFGEVERTNVSGSFGFGKRTDIGLRWSTRVNAETEDTRDNQLRLTARFPVIPRRVDFHASVNYDVNRELWQLQRYLMSYRGSCYSLSLELSDYRTGTRRDTQYRFLVTLKNVGTFLDINGGQTEDL